MHHHVVLEFQAQNVQFLLSFSHVMLRRRALPSCHCQASVTAAGAGAGVHARPPRSAELQMHRSMPINHLMKARVS